MKTQYKGGQKIISFDGMGWDGMGVTMAHYCITACSEDRSLASKQDFYLINTRLLHLLSFASLFEQC